MVAAALVVTAVVCAAVVVTVVVMAAVVTAAVTAGVSAAAEVVVSGAVAVTLVVGFVVLSVVSGRTVVSSAPEVVEEVGVKSSCGRGSEGSIVVFVTTSLDSGADIGAAAVRPAVSSIIPPKSSFLTGSVVLTEVSGAEVMLVVSMLLHEERSTSAVTVMTAARRNM